MQSKTVEKKGVSSANTKEPVGSFPSIQEAPKMRQADRDGQSVEQITRIGLSLTDSGHLSLFIANNSMFDSCEVTLQNGRFEFNATDSLAIILDLAEPHLDSLAQFYLADFGALLAEKSALDIHHARELAALHHELKAARLLLSAIQAVIASSMHAREG